MHLSFLGSFVLALALDLVPALVVVRWIRSRARAAGVPAGRHAGAAVVGGLIAGIVGNSAVMLWYLNHMGNLGPVAARWLTELAIAGGMCGSALAAGAAYLHLRMSAQRDPDYEEPATRR